MLAGSFVLLAKLTSPPGGRLIATSPLCIMPTTLLNETLSAGWTPEEVDYYVGGRCMLYDQVVRRLTLFDTLIKTTPRASFLTSAEYVMLST